MRFEVNGYYLCWVTYTFVTTTGDTSPVPLDYGYLYFETDTNFHVIRPGSAETEDDHNYFDSSR